jgi:hypothetical protein
VAEKEIQNTHLTNKQRELQKRAKKTGALGQKAAAFAPPFAGTNAEKLLSNPSNTAHIVLGQDRQSLPTTGYGGQAHVACAAIDLVVGRGSAKSDKEKANALKGGKVHPDMIDDAARIYISQKADPDKYFGLQSGKAENLKGVSTAAIKADAVRIMGREGIKLVTHSDKKNSRGKDRYKLLGIDLNAGNVAGDQMQPLVKGENLKKCIDDIYTSIADLRKLIDDLSGTVNDLSGQFRDHFHPTAAGPTSPSPHALASDIVQKLDWGAMKFGLAKHAKTTAKAKAAYIALPTDKNYICSKYNNTN